MVLAAVVGAAHEAARAVQVRVAVAAAQVAGGGGGAAAVLGLATHGGVKENIVSSSHRPLDLRHTEGSSSWRRPRPQRTRACSSGGRTSALHSGGVTPVSCSAAAAPPPAHSEWAEQYSTVQYSTSGTLGVGGAMAAPHPAHPARAAEAAGALALAPVTILNNTKS